MLTVHSEEDLQRHIHPIVTLICSDENLNWGLVVILIAFMGVVAGKVKGNVEGFEKMLEIATVVAEHLADTGGPWMVEHGGWEGIFPTLEDMVLVSTPPNFTLAAYNFW